MTVKPSARFAMKLTPDQAIASASSPATARLAVQSLVADTVDFEVTLEATGIALLAQPAGVRFTVTAADPAREIPIQYAVSGVGPGELHARVVARSAAGRLLGPVSTTLYLGSNGSEIVHSDADPKAVELLQLSRSRAANRISDAEYRARRARVAGGGATSVVGWTAGNAEVRIEGQVMWTDSAGHTHPVAAAPVGILDAANPASPIIGESVTDKRGRYSIRIPDAFADSAIQVLVQAAGEDFVILTLDGEVQFIASDVVWCRSGNKVTVDLTANNVDSNNTAFSVHAALSLGTSYVRRRLGHPLDPIFVFFPSFGTFFDPGTPLISLLDLDRFDWDVSLHEYSHHVLHSLGLDDSSGGPHGLGFNNSEFLGKHDGITLAFNEGLATYLSITMQIAERGDKLDVPFVGDSYYTDTEDFGLFVDLETNDFGVFDVFETLRSGVGEDDELSVQRVVWDFYDKHDDAGDVGVAMGDVGVWDALVRAKPVTLSAAVDALLAALPPPQVTRAGCILGEHAVAPTAIAPPPDAMATATPPTFEWRPNGAGPTFHHNAFVVQIFGDGRPAPLLTSPVLSTTTFTPTGAEWSAVLQRAGRSIRWVVTGMQTDAPPTGPYPGCVNTMTIAR
ncbi:MAG TPA: hypothetical protein VH417_02655 [Vicinamibacterales bacterium]